VIRRQIISKIALKTKVNTIITIIAPKPDPAKNHAVGMAAVIPSAKM
jgi:hypothetical protein